MGVANFDEGPSTGEVPLDTYAAQGMTLHAGPLVQILPGVTTQGVALAPTYGVADDEFPQVVQGGGEQVGQVARGGAVVTFTGNVTQVGMVVSSKNKQYMTVWNQKGEMIAQLTWVPDQKATFLGIDTLGQPIGMFAYGNEELMGDNKGPYDAPGPAIVSDTWMWSLGVLCDTSADCDDHSVCTGAESCQNGVCIDGEKLDCESGDVCLVDSCDAALGCMYESINNCCHVDTDCAQGLVCDDTVCVVKESPGESSTGESSTGESSTDAVTATDASSGEDSSGGSQTTGEDTSTSSTGAPTSTSPTSDGEGPDEPIDPADEGTTTSVTGGSTGTDASTGDGPGTAVDEGGCGCRSSRERGGLYGALMLMLLRRRRAAAAVAA